MLCYYYAIGGSATGRFLAGSMYLALVLLLYCSVWTSQTVYKARPPNNMSTEPVFRIETGMHLAPARRKIDVLSDKDPTYMYSPGTGSAKNGAIVFASLTGKQFSLERVKEPTEGQQTPTTTKPQTIQGFPIAVIKR